MPTYFPATMPLEITTDEATRDDMTTPIDDEEPLESRQRFVAYVKRHRPHDILGRSGDPSYDPFCFYLQEVWNISWPHVNSHFYLTDRLHYRETLVYPMPEWAAQVMYLFDVCFPADSNLTTDDVLNVLRLCHYLDD